MHLRSLSSALTFACVAALCGCRNYVAQSAPADMTTPLPTIAWSSGTATPGSEARYGMPLVATSGVALFGFGGSPTRNATAWEYTPLGNVWEDLHASTPPASGRVGHCEAYLPPLNALLIIGGHDDGGAPQNTPLLLSLDKPAFTALGGQGPTPTTGCAAAWLASNSTAVIFGGNYGLLASSATWSYAPVTQRFTMLSPAHAPSPRMGASLVADPGPTGDPAQSQVLLFGGIGPGGELDDVWRWNGTDWGMLGTGSDAAAALTHAARPVARYDAGVALDAKRRLLYVFGGERAGVVLNDLWRLDLRTMTWQSLPLTGVPTGRAEAAVAYDQAGDRLLVFGGRGTAGALADGWTLSASTPK